MYRAVRTGKTSTRRLLLQEDNHQNEEPDRQVNHKKDEKEESSAPRIVNTAGTAEPKPAQGFASSAAKVQESSQRQWHEIARGSHAREPLRLLSCVGDLQPKPLYIILICIWYT